MQRGNIIRIALVAALTLAATACMVESDRYHLNRKAALEGDAVASFEVGITYMDDFPPNETDYAKAHFWLHLAQAGGIRGYVEEMGRQAMDKIDAAITPEERERSNRWIEQYEKTGKLPVALK